MISDVTVLSCGMQDVRIIDRVKHQSVWSCGCLVLAAVVIFLCSLHLPNVQGDVAEAISKIPTGARSLCPRATAWRAAWCWGRACREAKP